MSVPHDLPVTVVDSRKSWSLSDLKELWRFRELFYYLTLRDIKLRYKQTILGPLWFFIQPLFTTLVFTIVFGGMAQIPTGGLPPMLFYLAGTTAWNSMRMNHNGSMGSGAGWCKACHQTGVSFLGGMDKKSLTHEAKSGQVIVDCSQSGCHRPLGNKGAAYTKWD